MSLIFSTITLSFLFNVLRKRKKRFVYLVLISTFSLCLFSLILNLYLKNVIGWEYGVAGADLSAHFNAAKAIDSGFKIDQLYLVHYRFEMNFQNLCYFIYSYILYVFLYCPTIIDIEFSLHIFYFVQILIAVLSSINFADFFAKEDKYKKYIFIFFISCSAIGQMASVLMRDIWIVFFMSLYFLELKKEKKRLSIIIVLNIILFILRNYMIFITIPLFFHYFFPNKKYDLISSFSLTGVLIFGNQIISNFARLFSIRWVFDFDFNVLSLFEFFMFPNILTQSYNVQHPNTSYHYLFGGNTEFIYYLLACWNCFVYPVCIYGFYKNLKYKNIRETCIWGIMIINIALLYGIFYDSVSEPRHKLMIIYSLAYFYSIGISKINKKILIILWMIIFYSLFFIYILKGTII